MIDVTLLTERRNSGNCLPVMELAEGSMHLGAVMAKATVLLPGVAL